MVMNCELRIVNSRDDIFERVCKSLDNNIVKENLRENGGTLNYTGIVYGTSFIILAALGNEIIGFNAVLESPRELYISQIAVKKKYQQKGVGLQMMRKVIEMAKESGKIVTADVRDYNELSKKMFATLGFTQTYSVGGNGFYELNPEQRGMEGR
jgi:ribosomal protein S18 acetylase RimI-like enzyme